MLLSYILVHEKHAVTHKLTGAHTQMHAHARWPFLSRIAFKHKKYPCCVASLFSLNEWLKQMNW